MDRQERKRILEQLLKHYAEISAATELILRVDPEEWDRLLQKRGGLIVQCQEYFNQLETVPSDELAQDELYRQLQQVIMSTVTQDEIILHEMAAEKATLQEQLPVVPERQRAATMYKLQSRYEE